MPPHFQFSTNAKSEEREKIKLEVFKYLKQTKAKFGRDAEVWDDPTIGLNEKGGMDDEEFEMYLINLLHVIYPDSSDKSGMRVLVKIDSGPGQSNMELLARLQMKGIILYPGVPNTTSVSQETNQNYGQFKSVYRENLENFAASRERTGKSTSANIGMIGMFVFGGIDPETGNEYKDAFQAGFSKEQNLSAWRKVGAAPLTRACLQDEQVRHDVCKNDEEDPMSAKLRKIQAMNNSSVYFLNSLGYNGDALMAKLQE